MQKYDYYADEGMSHVVPPPDDNYHDEEHEKTAEQEEEDRRSQSKRCVRLVDFFMMGTAVGLAYQGVQAIPDSYGSESTILTYAATLAAFGLFLNAGLGCVAVGRKKTTSLMIYHSFSIVLSLGFVMIGGLFFILLDSTLAYIDNNWDEILADKNSEERSSADKEDTKDTVTMNSYIIGGLCIFSFLLSLSSMSNVTTVASREKAYTVVLQATNTTILPIGVALIVASLFVADTAVTAEAPVTAFAMFIMGVFVVALSVLGCIGAALHSRGIIKLFMIFVVILSALFVGFGIGALVQADKIEGYINDNWESIRQVLPPSFSGRHDKEQFQRFVESNLRALGYISLIAGLLLSFQWWASRQLRFTLKEKQTEKKNEEDGLKALTNTKEDRPNVFRTMWKQQWTYGSPTSRRVIGCCCVCIILVVLIVIGLSTLALFFSTSCSTFGEHTETYERVLNASVDNVHYRNMFTRGVVSAEIDEDNTNFLFDVEIGAFRSGMGPSEEEEVQHDPEMNSHGLEMEPAEPTLVLGFDISCQSAETTIHVPAASIYGGNSHEDSMSTPGLLTTGKGRRAGVDIDLTSTDFSSRPRFNRVRAETEGGIIEFKGLVTGSNGLQAKTEAGQILIEQMDASCDPNKLGSDDGNVRFTTETGAVTAENCKLWNCDMHATTDYSLILVTDVQLHTKNGGGTFAATSFKGRIELRDTEMENYELDTQEGSIQGLGLRASEGIRISSTEGFIKLTGTRMNERGVVQVESGRGSVSLSFNQFAGIVSIATEGTITCTGEGFDAEDGEKKCPISEKDGDVKIVDQVNANCEDNGDCPYSGEISVVSQEGDVTIHIEKWDRS
eukprot:gb/GECG01011041.1/.p1 GENE.gb/GECG01011041.1/~~gb/GECG01011041.1/.p1  ORF type:complete len:842 (+),score=105.37 gb/GECG01011041.1/:1-2526(+)